MTSEHWRRLNEVFQSALDLPPEAREPYVKKECASDLALRLKVTDMLRNHARESGLLDRSPWRARAEPSHTRVFAAGDIVAQRYEIARLAGRGGMGEVYEAWDLDLNENIALKTLLPEIAANEQMVKRFKREIQLARKISHPNVCKIFDLARHPLDAPPEAQTLFLTMELLSGETLLSSLERQGRMPPARALPVLAQIADALGAAHAAGVVHRDLKASNIILVPVMDGSLRPVVTDFGLARRTDAQAGEGRITETGKLLGTWDYMAPELLEGTQASPASDIYSLGILSYIVVTGGRPFPENSPIQAILRCAWEPIPPPSTLAPQLEPHWDAAILRCLERDPARRYARATEFAAALIGWRS